MFDVLGIGSDILNGNYREAFASSVGLVAGFGFGVICGGAAVAGPQAVAAPGSLAACGLGSITVGLTANYFASKALGVSPDIDGLIP